MVICLEAVTSASLSLHFSSVDVAVTFTVPAAFGVSVPSLVRSAYSVLSMLQTTPCSAAAGNTDASSLTLPRHSSGTLSRLIPFAFWILLIVERNALVPIFVDARLP